MAESRFKPVKKEELSSLVDRAIQTSVGFYDSKLSRERQDVLDYYNGRLPKPAHAGNSKYVSMDVFDSVESLKAVLLETFSAGSKIVSFDPQGEEDVVSSRAKARLPSLLFSNSYTLRYKPVQCVKHPALLKLDQKEEYQGR